MSDDVPFDNPILDILCGEKKPPTWLIPDVISQGSLICFAGEPGTGKSVTSYMTGLALASGCRAFSGIIPAGEPKRVLYFDEENALQIRDEYLRRCFFGLQAANHGEEPDLGNLQDNFWPVHSRLGHEDWAETAAEFIEQLRPHVVVFDTATPAFDIADENSNAEATQVVKDLRKLMTICDSTMWVLRHAKIKMEKGGRRTMRGAKAWQGAADGVIFQVKAGGRPRKNGLNLTRWEPDKVRAFGLTKPLYFSPRWTTNEQGIILDASYSATKDHKEAEQAEDAELDTED